jgi:hypothetical protein
MPESCSLTIVCDDNDHWIVQGSVPTRSAQGIVEQLGGFSELTPCKEASVEMGTIVVTWTPTT